MRDLPTFGGELLLNGWADDESMDLHAARQAGGCDDVPTLRLCMSNHPEGKSCGHVRCRLEGLL